MALCVRAEDKKIIITGSVKTFKDCVTEWVEEFDCDGSDLESLEFQYRYSADELTTIPDLAELCFDCTTIAKMGENMQLVSITNGESEIIAEIAKNTIPGKIFHKLRQNIDLDQLALFCEYYPVAL